MNNEHSLLELAIIKPNRINYSETFIENHIKLLPGKKHILYEGFFPLRKPDGSLLIDSKLGLISYLFQKKVLKRKKIAIRTKYLVNYFKENKINVVFAEYGPTGALVKDACEKLGIPLIVIFHGFDISHRATVQEYLQLYKEMSLYAFAIIGVSRYMVNELISIGMPPEKVFYNPYGVETSYFKCSPVLQSKPIFLSVARFAEKKGPLQTLKAFKMVLKEVPEARLIMAGIGPMWEECKLFAQEVGISASVEFKGIVTHEDIRSLMNQSRAFVQHSVKAPSGDMEGTPNSILEASSSCLPIVSTRHAGIPDSVIENKTGFLVEEHDVEGMAAYMIKFAKDPELASRMGKAGRLFMLENFEMKERIETIANLLHAALNSHSMPI